MAMKFRLAVAAMLVAAWSISVSATTLVRMSLDQLAQASSQVVQGHVVSQTSEWNPQHTEIVTLTTVAVDQNVKGNTPSSIVVEQLGGTIGHFRVYVPGTVQFFPQAHYELFLQPSPANASRFHLVGMEEGAFRIYQDPRTGQERVINPMGRSYYEKATGGRVSALPETMPFTEFQQKVSTALAKPIAIPAGTAMPVVVRSASFNGVGRVLVEAQTTTDLFPNAHVVIPAGSTVDGWASESSGQWTIYWTAVTIGNRQAAISAESQAPSGGSLEGRRFMAVTR